MKKAFTYIITLLLGAVLGIFLFYPSIKNKPEAWYPPASGFTNPSLSLMDQKIDSLNTIITSLNDKNRQIKSGYLLQQKMFTHKLQETAALKTDSQVIVFKARTTSQVNVFETHTAVGDTSTSKIIANRRATSSDTIVHLPVSHIRIANLKIIALDTMNTRVEMLEQILINQKSLMLTHNAVNTRLQAQIGILVQQSETLQQSLIQKDKEIIKQKTKHRIELAVAGVLIVLAVL